MLLIQGIEPAEDETAVAKPSGWRPSPTVSESKLHSFLQLPTGTHHVLISYNLLYFGSLS